jgi:anti-sigma factor (TIGR02949 family)
MGDACDEVLHRLEAFLDREDPADIRAAVEEHLRFCPPCMDRADFEQRLRAIVASRCREAAPVGLLDQVRARLHLGT